MDGCGIAELHNMASVEVKRVMGSEERKQVRESTKIGKMGQQHSGEEERGIDEARGEGILSVLLNLTHTE